MTKTFRRPPNFIRKHVPNSTITKLRPLGLRPEPRPGSLPPRPFSQPQKESEESLEKLHCVVQGCCPKMLRLRRRNVTISGAGAETFGGILLEPRMLEPIWTILTTVKTCESRNYRSNSLQRTRRHSRIYLPLPHSAKCRRLAQTGLATATGCSSPPSRRS